MFLQYDVYILSFIWCHPFTKKRTEYSQGYALQPVTCMCMYNVAVQQGEGKVNNLFFLFYLEFSFDHTYQFKNKEMWFSYIPLHAAFHFTE